MMYAPEPGLSANAIVARSRDGHPSHLDYPRDPADFRRCQLALRTGDKGALALMRDIGPEWSRLVDAWDEIHALIETEVPGYLNNRSRGAAPRAYALMKRVIRGGVKCPTCDGTGQAEACEKCKGTGRRCGGRCRNLGCFHGYTPCRSCGGRGFTGGA